MADSWEIERKQDHWLDVKQDTYTAAVKWDGCIHFNEHHESGDTDYLHICDLDGFIDMMIALRDTAKQHFGEDWGK